MSRNWNQGWGHRSGRHNNWWVFPLIFFVIFIATGAWRSGWMWWIIIPVFFGFVLPAIKRNVRAWGDQSAWAHEGYYKHKRGDIVDGEFYEVDDEKSKRDDDEPPVYYVGDDGELIEMPQDKSKRVNRGDQPPQYV